MILTTGSIPVFAPQHPVCQLMMALKVSTAHRVLPVPGSTESISQVYKLVSGTKAPKAQRPHLQKTACPMAVAELTYSTGP